MKELTLEAIQNFERYFARRPLNEVRIREGFPTTTIEQIALEARTQRRVGPFVSDVKRR